MRHLLACDFPSDRWLLAAGIFHNLKYTNLALSDTGTHKINFEHTKQKTTNLLIKNLIWILLDNKNSDT